MMFSGSQPQSQMTVETCKTVSVNKSFFPSFTLVFCHGNENTGKKLFPERAASLHLGPSYLSQWGCTGTQGWGVTLSFCVWNPHDRHVGWNTDGNLNLTFLPAFSSLQKQGPGRSLTGSDELEIPVWAWEGGWIPCYLSSLQFPQVFPFGRSQF